MALTNQQVQQAYLSVLGRPAEGDAVLWGSLATDVPGLINTIITIRNGVDFNKDNTIFVQNLYENLLGRTGDDEGLSFWVASLHHTKQTSPSRANLNTNQNHKRRCAS